MNNRPLLDLSALVFTPVKADGGTRLRDLRARAELDVLRALMDMRKAPERTGCNFRGSAKVGGEKK